MSIWESMHTASTVSQKISLKYMGLFFLLHFTRDVIYICVWVAPQGATLDCRVCICVCALCLWMSTVWHQTLFFMICKNKEQSAGPRHTRFPYSPPQIHWRQSLNICLFRAGGKKGEKEKKNERRERQDDWMRCIFLFLKELKMSGFLQRLSRRGILDEKIKKGIWKRMWVESRQTYTVSPSKQFFWLNIHTSVMFLHWNACFCHGEQVFCVCGEQRRETSRWHLQRGDACILALNWWRSRSGAAEGWKR